MGRPEKVESVKLAYGSDDVFVYGSGNKIDMLDKDYVKYRDQCGEVTTDDDIIKSFFAASRTGAFDKKKYYLKVAATSPDSQKKTDGKKNSDGKFIYGLGMDGVSNVMFYDGDSISSINTIKRKMKINPLIVKIYLLMPA